MAQLGTGAGGRDIKEGNKHQATTNRAFRKRQLNPFTMKYLLVLFFTIFYSCHSATSKKEQDKEADSIRSQKMEVGTEMKKDSVSLERAPEASKEPIQTETTVLQPVPREIPIGEKISPALLSMQAEYDCYPLSTAKVKVTITNYSHAEYECGESYSLAYYDKKEEQWEALPTNPIINDILWLIPSGHSHQQTITLYTSEISNRPGKYRIYKTFNRDTKVGYAKFELVDRGKDVSIMNKNRENE
ncbi:immunoglobulin-like domain-containing protein [Bacteroides congonensis]